MTALLGDEGQIVERVGRFNLAAVGVVHLVGNGAASFSKSVCSAVRSSWRPMSRVRGIGRSTAAEAVATM